MKAIVNSQSEFKSVTEILENIYPEILQDMKDDDYTIQYEDYESFFEIEYEGDIAGFYTLERFDGIEILNEIYILRKFRGRNITFDKIMEFFAASDMDFWVRNPNQSMIQTLLKHNLAFNIGNNIIYSAVEFVVSSSEVYKNSRIKSAYRNLTEDIFLSASFYDNDLKAIITSNEGPLFKRKWTLAVIEPRKNDLKKYKLRKKLKSVTFKVLDNKMMFISDSMDKVDDFEEECYNNIINMNSIDRLISDDTLDDLSKTWDIDKKDLKKIHDAVKKSVDDGEVHPRYAGTRMNYLLERPFMIDRKADMNLLPDYCPFCKNIVSDDVVQCPLCAFSFEGLSPEDIIIEDENKLYHEVVENAEENNWDLDEIFDLQCLHGTYEFIYYSKNVKYLSIERLDESNKVEHGSIGDYAVKHGYLRKCTYDEYIDIIENKFSRKDLKTEAQHYGLNENQSKAKLIRDIKNNVSPEDISIEYLVTEKGWDLYENSEILKFHTQYLRFFLFYEFKKFCDEHDYSINEAGEKFIEQQFSKCIEKKNWRIYKNILFYELENTDDPKERFKLAVQMLIYDINCDDLRDDFNLGYELDTAIFLKKYLPEVGGDAYDLFEEAYEEFKLDELKGSKDKVSEKLTEIAEDIDPLNMTIEYS